MSMQLIPTETEINTLALMAKNASASKFYNSLGGESGILTIMLLAKELDISPMQALSGGIWNIQGKVEMSARMMNMKIRQAGHKLKIESDMQQCIITGIRKDTGEELTVKFSMEDAARAGLSGRDTWKKYPREMLFNRCLSIIARMLFPDVIGNAYVEGEIRESIEVQEEEKSKHKKSKTVNEVPVEYTSIEVVAENQTKKEVDPVETQTEQDLPLTQEQQEELVTLLQGKENRLKKFLEFYKINQLSDLPQKHFHDAVFVLQRSEKKEKANAA